MSRAGVGAKGAASFSRSSCAVVVWLQVDIKAEFFPLLIGTAGKAAGGKSSFCAGLNGEGREDVWLADVGEGPFAPTPIVCDCPLPSDIKSAEEADLAFVSPDESLAAEVEFMVAQGTAPLAMVPLSEVTLASSVSTEAMLATGDDGCCCCCCRPRRTRAPIVCMRRGRSGMVQVGAS